MGQFAYSISLDASTSRKRFWAPFHLNPVMKFKTPNASHLQLEIQADATLTGLAETHWTLWENILEDQLRQRKYAGGKEITFDIGEKVLLSTKHIKTTRPSKKLNNKCAGPWTVSKVINRNDEKLDLLKTLRNHNVFHFSQLDPYTPTVPGLSPNEPLPIILHISEDWERECIHDSKRRYQKLHDLILWAGYRYVRTCREPADNLSSAQELVDGFHVSHLGKLL